MKISYSLLSASRRLSRNSFRINRINFNKKCLLSQQLSFTDRMVVGGIKAYLFGYCLVGITAIVMSGGLVLYVVGSQIHKHHSIQKWNDINRRQE